MKSFHKALPPCAMAAALAALLPVRPAVAIDAVDSIEQARFSSRLVNHSTSALDASLSTESARIESTAIASLRTRELVRLESALVWEPEDSPLRLKLGDTTSNPGAWGSAVRFAGVQLGTPFELRNDLLYAPRLALTGVAVVPTAADALLATANAPAAGLSERGLSTGRLIPGTSGVSLTAYDAAGRSASFNRSLVAAPRRVDAGCRNYSLSFGRVRENYGLQQDAYGPWFANTTLACGLEGGRTLEAHGEFLAGEAGLAGLTLLQPIGSHASASLAAATSENDEGNGYSLQMGLQRELDRVAVGLQARVQTSEYRELGRELAGDDVISQRMLASIATRFNDRSTLALAYAMQRTFALERTDVIGLTQTLRFRSGGSVTFGANRAVNDQRYSSLNLSFSRPLVY